MTPIVGLTNRQPQFPQIGQLRKGKKDEQGRPIDLDYFRFTSEVPGVAETFNAIYGEEPRLINVFLPHQTTDENWEAWNEEYVASGLVHRCDGEYVVRYRNAQTGDYVTPEPNTLKCPYASGEKQRTQSQGCHPTGRLQVVMRELKRFAYVMVTTSAFNDIPKLDGQLRALEGIYGDLRGIPMQLRRVPSKISTPKSEKRDGQWVRTKERARRESWLLSIEAAPDWADMQLESQRIQALPEIPEPFQIEAPNTVEGEVTAIPDEAPDVPPEPEEPAEEVEAPPTLAEALKVGIPKDAPKLGLEAGAPLSDAVRLDAKDLMGYLATTGPYDEPTSENIATIAAATVVFNNWDEAQGIVSGEPVEEIVVEEGEAPPLF